MALIQLNINRLGQGWFILWEEAVLGGSLGVYQAAEVPGRWMERRDGGMQDGARGLVPAPGDRRDGTTNNPALWDCPPSPSGRMQGNGVKNRETGTVGTA